MSQFVRVSINALKNVDPGLFNHMIKNLKVDGHGALSLNTKKHSIHVPQALGRKTEDDVDCVLQENGVDTSIGFKIRGENNILQIRGDFWRTGFDEKTFGNIIAQNYTVEKVKRNAKIAGQNLVKKTVKNDGAIVLRYAV